MSREIKEDFNKLIDFIDNYDLSHLIKDDEFKKYLSQMHKKYFAILAFVFELKNLKDNKANYILNSKQKDFILEAISDLGNAVFLIINGAYKPARLIMRSAIETFLKGISINEIADIDKEKRIYQMFERISNVDFFNNDINKELFDNLKYLYSELSMDTHTANTNNMQQTSSLDYFPTKSIPKIEENVNLFCNISQSMLTILAFFFNEQYHRMYVSNKNIIIKNIKKKYRQKINNIE